MCWFWVPQKWPRRARNESFQRVFCCLVLWFSTSRSEHLKRIKHPEIWPKRPRYFATTIAVHGGEEVISWLVTWPAVEGGGDKQQGGGGEPKVSLSLNHVSFSVVRTPLPRNWRKFVKLGQILSGLETSIKHQKYRQHLLPDKRICLLDTSDITLEHCDAKLSSRPVVQWENSPFMHKITHTLDLLHPLSCFCFLPKWTLICFEKVFLKMFVTAQTFVTCQHSSTSFWERDCKECSTSWIQICFWTFGFFPVHCSIW